MGRVSLDSPVPASWPAALPQPAHSKRHAGSPEMTGQPHQTDWAAADPVRAPGPAAAASPAGMRHTLALMLVRSEEHTSELQSPCNLVCRLLLEKKTTIQSPSATDFVTCHRLPTCPSSPGVHWQLRAPRHEHDDTLTASSPPAPSFAITSPLLV